MAYGKTVNGSSLSFAGTTYNFYDLNESCSVAEIEDSDAAIEGTGDDLEFIETGKITRSVTFNFLGPSPLTLGARGASLILAPDGTTLRDLGICVVTAVSLTGQKNQAYKSSVTLKPCRSTTQAWASGD